MVTSKKEFVSFFGNLRKNAYVYPGRANDKKAAPVIL